MSVGREEKLKRHGSRHYVVDCDEGHNFGMVDNPSGGLECCYKAMIRVLASAYEDLLLTSKQAGEKAG